MKKKRGMTKKIFVFTVLAIILLLAMGVFAQEVLEGEIGLTEEEQQEVEEQVEEVADPSEIADNVQEYVEKFVEKRGIGAEDINNVNQVDFGDLPEDVNIENVNNANLAIYEVDYNETEEKSEEIYVITYSTQDLGGQGDLVVAKDKRQFLHFGLSDETAGSTFLNTAAGVPGSIGVGYVMMRHGSITGLSTNLEVTGAAKDKEIEVIVYKNDEIVRFGNVLYASLDGVQKDYDIQSKDVVKFEPGDVISIYMNAEDIVAYKNVITMIEITTVE